MTMRITIVDRIEGDGLGIVFESPLGRSRGSWQGPGPAPASGVFEVEFSCREDLAWDVEITVLPEPVAPSLGMTTDGSRVVGTLAAVDDDAVTIDLGLTSLVVGVLGDAPTEYEGVAVEADIRVLEVFPYEV